MTDDDSFLRIDQVAKRFGTIVAVDSVTLAIRRGEFFSLLGPSGCGKTTLLRMIGGFTLPDEGSIFIDGEDVTKLPPNKRPSNMVFQSYAIFPHLNVRDNIAYGLRSEGVRTSERDARVAEALAMIKLEQYGERRPHELSGGERQRVALARALVKRPKVLLLDEPLGALDKRLREAMQIELRELQREVGISFVFVTHDQEEALSMSDKVAVMNGGRIEQFGTPAEVYLRPATRFVAGFLGAINWFGSAGVRPESTRLEREKPEGFPCHRASVESSLFLGNCVHINAALENGEHVVAEIPLQQNHYHEGESVWIHWNPESEIRFE